MSSSVQQAILDVLGPDGSWWTPQELADRVGVAPSTARHNLIQLMNRGAVKRRQIRNALHYAAVPND